MHDIHRVKAIVTNFPGCRIELGADAYRRQRHKTFKRTYQWGKAIRQDGGTRLRLHR